MTVLAKIILSEMGKGETTAEAIHLKGIGSSVYEVEFIMEQIKIAKER